MALTASHRAALEAAVQSAISRIPETIQTWRKREALKKYEIKDTNEFIYGYVLGFISNAFYNIMFISEGRVPRAEEYVEANAIIAKHVSQIKEAILVEGFYLR